MRISIRHATTYAYSEPIARVIQYLRLTPRASVRQHVRAWRVEAPGSVAAWTDHHRNPCHTVVIREPLTEVTITCSGQVETVDTGGVVPPAPTDLPAALYLRQTLFTRTDPKLADFADSFADAIARDPVDGLHDLMLGVARAVRYQTNGTHVHTTAAEAFADGVGVCQDHAHIFIACCRRLGIPARYIGGYLATTEGAASHEAGHAWASALVPALGWVSFDPANGVSATERYVRAAIGFDYADAGPVRGVRIGGGEEKLAVEVRLQAEGARQQ
jgi:transglutaminase-like putative cysteine protease